MEPHLTIPMIEAIQDTSVTDFFAKNPNVSVVIEGPEFVHDVSYKWFYRFLNFIGFQNAQNYKYLRRAFQKTNYQKQLQKG